MGLLASFLVCAAAARKLGAREAEAETISCDAPTASQLLGER